MKRATHALAIASVDAYGKPTRRHLDTADVAVLSEQASVMGLTVAALVEELVSTWCADRRHRACRRCEHGPADLSYPQHQGGDNA